MDYKLIKLLIPGEYDRGSGVFLRNFYLISWANDWILLSYKIKLELFSVGI